MSDANDIAKYFAHKAGLAPTKHIMSRINVDAGNLLENGFTRDELVAAIDFCVDVRKIKMYSFGFIVTQIHKVMHDLRIHNELEKIKTFKSTPISEVKQDGKSGERNRNKLSRFGAQPRFGEELDLNLFKES